jgi:hypothetical protein
MKFTCDTRKTQERLKDLNAYFKKHVLRAGRCICGSFSECRQSHVGKIHNTRFHEAQLHHVGKFYDLLFDRTPLRIVVVGMEYGHWPPCVSLQDRYEMIMRCGLHKRFGTRDSWYEKRNPHMNGTTSVLRLLMGQRLGADHVGEYIAIGDERVHVFDTFALVNYLLCSAVIGEKMKGMGNSTMRRNCNTHFCEALKILEPTVVVVQGAKYWDSIEEAFGALGGIEEKSRHVYRAKIGNGETCVLRFTHPSAYGENNWGLDAKRPYLIRTVGPTVKSALRQLKEA